MGDLHVARWRRYGKDRLYVNDDGGARVGWVDLLAGTHQLERAELRDPFRAAVEGFCSVHAVVAPNLLAGAAPSVLTPPEADDVRARSDTPVAAPPVVRAEAAPQPAAAMAVTRTGARPETSEAMRQVAAPGADNPWRDLALNVPGQAARAQAAAEAAALRERSRIGAFLARALDVKTDERAWRVGADGEETVGARLEKLAKRGWHVLHAVPVGERGADIDHVLIGPGGVWTINTKTHPGGRVWVGRQAVRVNGHPTQYLRNSRFEAQRAQRLLTEACGFPVFAEPALVFLTGTLIPNVTIKQAPEDVTILDRMDIPGAFRRSSRKLTHDQVARIYQHARRSTTWQP